MPKNYPDEAFRHLRESIVAIEGEKGFMGTGALIGDYVLCTHHEIAPMLKEKKEESDTEKGEVVSHRDNRYGFRFVHHDEEADLALLYVRSDGFFMPPKISGISHVLAPDRDIRVLGFQNDRTVYNQKGRITAIDHLTQDVNTKREYKNRFLTDTYAEHGMSGGFLADPSGSFLGVITAKSLPKEHAIGVGMEIVTPFLLNAAAKEAQNVLKYKRV